MKKFCSIFIPGCVNRIKELYENFKDLCFVNRNCFTSCKKNSVKLQQLPDGLYAGNFNYINTNPAVDYRAVSGNVNLSIQGQNYSCTSPVTNFGAAAKGSIAISDQQIIFRDSTIHTANFDWQIILNGTYDATTKNDSLVLVKKIKDGVYTYKLKRQ